MSWLYRLADAGVVARRGGGSGKWANWERLGEPAREYAAFRRATDH